MEDDRLGTGLDQQEIVDETVTEVIPWDALETHIDVKLITQENDEWKNTIGVKIVPLIGDET